MTPPLIPVALALAAGIVAGWQTHRSGGRLPDILMSTWFGGALGFIAGLPVACTIR